MKKKAEKPFRMLPLQRGTVREITDPAEQAALDERIKRAEKALALRSALEWCGELSEEQRIEVMEHLAAQLPADVLRGFAERWGGQLTAVANGGNGADRTK